MRKKYKSAAAQNKIWSEVAKDKCLEPEYVSRQSTKQKLCTHSPQQHFTFFVLYSVLQLLLKTNKPKYFNLTFSCLIFLSKKKEKQDE